jgi:DNA-binding transcriptional ArsR family regulator
MTSPISLSKTEATLTDQLRAELYAITGAPQIAAPSVVPDADFKIAHTTRSIRRQLKAAAESKGIGIRELAKRLGVSPPAVSRHLSSDGDLRISTAVLLADAMELEWKFSLTKAAAIIDATAIGANSITTSRVSLGQASGSAISISRNLFARFTITAEEEIDKCRA